MRKSNPLEIGLIVVVVVLTIGVSIFLGMRLAQGPSAAAMAPTMEADIEAAREEPSEPASCQQDAMVAYADAIEKELLSFRQQASLTASTPLVSMGTPLQRLLDLQTETRNIAAPGCVADYHERTLRMMEIHQVVFQGLASQEIDDQVAAIALEEAARYLDEAEADLESIRAGSPPPSPTPLPPTETASPTRTPRPTNTSRPTNTPAPTHTPQPSATPSPMPSPTSIPTPIPPQEFTGRGAKVLSLTVPILSKIYLGHEGRSNFIVHAFSSDGDTETLVNEIGYYAGNRLISAGSYDLEIDADGPWLIRVTPMSWDETAGSAIEGRGDDIRGLFTPLTSRTAYRFTHQGQSNFIVHITCNTGEDFLVNEIGPFDGEAMVVFGDAEACLWDVHADGVWTIAPK